MSNWALYALGAKWEGRAFATTQIARDRERNCKLWLHDNTVKLQFVVMFSNTLSLRRCSHSQTTAQLDTACGQPK